MKLDTTGEYGYCNLFETNNKIIALQKNTKAIDKRNFM